MWSVCRSVVSNGLPIVWAQVMDTRVPGVGPGTRAVSLALRTVQKGFGPNALLLQRCQTLPELPPAPRPDCHVASQKSSKLAKKLLAFLQVCFFIANNSSWALSSA